MQIRAGLAGALCALTIIAGGCASVPNTPSVAPPAAEPATPSPPAAPPLAESPQPPAPVPVAPPVAEPPASQVDPYVAANWSALPDWTQDNVAEALPALLLSCTSLKNEAEWQAACAAAAEVRRDDPAAARRFFETSFLPYAIRNSDGSMDGLVTGYYEPLLKGSRTRSKTYKYPLYGVPDDLLVVELAEANPTLKGVRLRGRMLGKKIVPYYTRAEIERGDAAVRGRELLWVDDPVDLFFLQVQGSGRVRLADGETVRVGFAEHNGHPYKSVGRVLIERGELSPDKASMQGIKQWAKQNPDLLPMLLQQNPAYVFFRELPGTEPGPIGALGVALTPGRSIAIDPMAVPLGAPVYLSSTWPLSARPLNRLMLGQDTGSAIKGAVRADFFWGFGDDAGAFAGRMRQSGRMWLLYPKGFQPRLP